MSNSQDVLSGEALESAVMELIINAGESKSCSMEALFAAKKGEWEKVDACLSQASEASKRAHDVQTGLIGLDEGEGKVPVNLIMVHAQDHIMTAMLARELIEELIHLHRTIQNQSL
ncbi:PTS lactose/cellobiose transporter subunit IIA [Vibrio sp. S17_S38]|uniref:PTS lactose/cellobiose transporter subunit IIA n=1 Tax=Vibrio sp. S17_S38 TaxID=2720229 RepID=UPI001680548B|nr:PTS lactose/cellobiose transporter subunit IIA [Vibrio sp. S17_S38]MBD1574098.1 PTS lactose/cellobiose transporter subunit IIA [Vibrio sp. S17_S38]